MIRFHRYIWLYIVISVVIIGTGLFSLIRYGYRYSIDFTGGSLLSYQLSKPVSDKKISLLLGKAGIKIRQLIINKNEVDVRINPIDETKELTIRGTLEKEFNIKVKQLRFETVGPVLGKETTRKTMIAVTLAICGILLYMSFSFKGIQYALAAIFALIHDFLVLVGVYSLFSHFLGAEFDLLFVTALLTTMSFSVHDTIVIFDKVREYLKYNSSKSPEELTDKAINETLVRSLNNSLTIIFMLLALLLLGGDTIRFFIAALLVGTITGTYSSPFVATPFLLFLEKRSKKKR